MARTSLPGNPLAPGAARRFVRTALAEWTELALPGAEFITDLLVADAMVVVSELVTNAVVHAGDGRGAAVLTGRCSEDCPAAAGTARAFTSHDGPGIDTHDGSRSNTGDGSGNDSRPGPGPGSGVLVIEVSDHHPARVVRDDGAERPYDIVEYGRGLHLVSALSDAWGITYRTGVKTVWARLPVDGIATAEEEAEPEAYDGEHALRRGQRAAEILAPAPRRGMQDQDWRSRGVLSFLAEASDLLAGQLDEDLVAALTGQLLVPRLADWCAVWLEDEAPGRSDGGVVGGPRLARVWHGSENRIEELRLPWRRTRPSCPNRTAPGPCPCRGPPRRWERGRPADRHSRSG